MHRLLLPKLELPHVSPGLASALSELGYGASLGDADEMI